MMKTSSLLLLIIAGFISLNVHSQYCTDNTRYSELAYFDTTEISSTLNVPYGQALDYQGNQTNLVLDLYYPNLTLDTSALRPFVMLFHGGGFISGDKQAGDIRDLCIHLAMRGYVCASVNYRLGHNGSEYEQYKARYRAIQDGHAAMRFVVENANLARIDTNWLFIGGQSAGSMLAHGIIYADESEIDSVSLFYSPTALSAELGDLTTSGNNLTNSFSIKGLFNNWGAAGEDEVDLEEMVPTVSFHGDQDTVVLISSDTSFQQYILNGSATMHNQLVSNSICSELTIDPNGLHGIYRDESSVFRASRASCFFKSVFCSTCSNFYTTDSIPANCSSLSQISESSVVSSITIYPSPAQEYIQLSGLENQVVERVRLVTSSGTEVLRSMELLIDVSMLEPGIYYAIVSTDNGVYISKFVKV